MSGEASGSSGTSSLTAQFSTPCQISSNLNPSLSAATPNLNLTPDEKRLYGQLFRQADTDGVGVVTGDVAVGFFEKTRLDSTVLGEVSTLCVFAPTLTGLIRCIRHTDLAIGRQGESRLSNPRRLRNRSSSHRSCASRQRAYQRSSSSTRTPSTIRWLRTGPSGCGGPDTGSRHWRRRPYPASNARQGGPIHIAL